MNLRRVFDIAGGSHRRKSSRESFSGIFIVERADSAISGIYFAANVFLIAPCAGYKFGRKIRNGHRKFNSGGIGRHANFLSVIAEVI